MCDFRDLAFDGRATVVSTSVGPDAQVDDESRDIELCGAGIDVLQRVDDGAGVVIATPTVPDRLMIRLPIRPGGTPVARLFPPGMVGKREVDADELRGRG